jgi:hypothetical protein
MMNKVVDFLEKNCQWLAIGLGALYLGWMIWGYVVQAPITVAGVAPTPLTPGEVDAYILEKVSTPLDAAMKSTQLVEMPVPNFLDQFKLAMNLSDRQLSQMALLWDSQTQQIKLTPTSQLPSLPDNTLVKALPVLPPASVTGSSTGRSNVQIATAAPAAGAAPAVATPAPAFFGSPAAPSPDGATPASLNGAGPAAAAGPAPGTKDTCWVTVAFKIPHDQLAQSFKDAAVPNWFAKTSVLQIQLFRQESLPGDRWSDPQLIAPLNAASLQPQPADQDTLGQTNFLLWAQQHVVDILQPGFPQVNRGDNWFAPGAAPASAAPAALTALDPAQDYPSSVLSQYPADQRLAYFREKARLRNSQRNGTRGGSPSGMIRQPSPNAQIFADDVPPFGTNDNDLRGGSQIAPPRRPAQAPQPVAPPPPAAAAVPQAAPAPDLSSLYPVPPGSFDPSTLTADITGWAHDTSVQPGHTYRYMIAYRIANPVWHTSAAKNDPKIQNTFYIDSPPGTWSGPINVASTTNFFVSANRRPGAPTALIEVFKWQDGVEHSHTFEVAPGDLIGGKDGDVDYNTGWTVVDLRFDDPRNDGALTVLVMDPNGLIDRRDYKTDQAKPEHAALKNQLPAPAAPGPVAGGQ